MNLDHTNTAKRSNWTHPIHARGVRSPKFDFGHVGESLSNRKIDEYALEGRYGDEIRERVASRKTKKKRTETTLARALKMLKEFTE